jgi:Reverse transcriptase (RNA-dependent DNA polymerase)
VKLRNLGIAESFVRITAYMILLEALPFAYEKHLINDFDFGVAVPGGCEKFVKAAQAAAASGCTMISCDLEKAFNNILRKDIWDTVQELDCPLLTAWFTFFYHIPPRVHFAEDPSTSFSMNKAVTYTLSEGVAQGDPLSSFLFVITLSHILEQHRHSYPHFVRTSVIDDLCFIVAPSHSHIIPSALDALCNTLQQHNLSLNKSKTTIFHQDGFAFPVPNPTSYSMSHQGFTVCRVAVGTPSYCEADITTRLQKIAASELTFQRLHRALDFCQTRGRGLIFIDLLRLCFRSRFAWDMRILPPASACLIASSADKALKRLLCLVMPRHVPPLLPPEWSHLNRIHDIKINLPLLKGGLGLRSWSSLREISHFASWVESGPRLLRLFDFLRLSIHPSILLDIGNSVSFLSSHFTMPPEYWHMHPTRARTKTQHELTEMLDDAEIIEASSLSPDAAISSQFKGSVTPLMSLPFNSCLVPRAILDSLDNYAFSYALAWHTMMPLFSPSICTCSKMWDPLGLHAASCLHLNAYNLLHNSVRDCFAGAARMRVSKDQQAQVSYILTDKHAKSATWMHEFYPLKPDAPTIIPRDDPLRRSAPSLSPDILIAFLNDPLMPYFGDFVASSPSATNKLKHGEAAQVKFTEKLQYYSKHHVFPPRVCYPLAFERSGYIHPAFNDFIDLYARSSSSSPQPQTALQLRFSVAFAITFTTANLIRAASRRLLPSSLLPFIPPKPIVVPVCWAPSLPSPSLITSSRFCTHLSTRTTSTNKSSRAHARPHPTVPRALPSEAPAAFDKVGGGRHELCK